MDKRDGYALILNAMIEEAKKRGMAQAGSDYALACHQLIETAMAEAEAWDVPLAEIGLEGFNSNDLLIAAKKRAA